jgi:putative toxin-antitoxin system antitoxin component (TIGR02293 family)
MVQRLSEEERRDSALIRRSGVEGTASVLGLENGRGRPKSTLELINDIEKGLPVAALDRLTDLLAPDDADFRFAVVPKGTLARRRSHPGARLSPNESDRVARLAKVWGLAKNVWQTNEDARAFLFRPHPLLTGRRPIDVALATEIGARLVEEILGRLKFGSAA